MFYLRESGNLSHPAIVFLHGGGLSSLQWQPQLDALSSDYYCIAPDLPEQGKSAGTKPFTLEGTAQKVATIIREHVPAGKAHVVGLSLGGSVALTLARLQPQLVDHVVVSGTSAGVGKILGEITLASAGMYKLFSKETLVKQAFKQFNIPEKYHPMLRDDLMLAFNADFTRNFTRELMKMQLPSTANLLVLVGGKETFVAKSDARKLVRQINSAKGAQVAGVGHVWNLEAPDLFTDTLRTFLADQPLPAALKPF